MTDSARNLQVDQVANEVNSKGFQFIHSNSNILETCDFETVSVTAVSCHHYHTSVHCNVTALSLSLLLYRCQFTSLTH